jgi:hypothetical protein
MGKGDVLVVRRGNIQTITVVFVVLIAILGSTKINIRKDLVSHVRLVSTKEAMAEIIVMHVRLVSTNIPMANIIVLHVRLVSTKIAMANTIVSHVRLVSTKIAMAEIIVLHVRLVVALTGFRGELLPVTLVMLVSLRQGVERQHVQDVQRVK